MFILLGMFIFFDTIFFIKDVHIFLPVLQTIVFT